MDRAHDLKAVGQLTFHCNEGETYDPGSIRITLPLYLFKERDGAWTGSSVKVGVPAAPQTNSESSFNYTIDGKNGTVIISNWDAINSTLTFTCKFEYNVPYSQWGGVYGVRNGEWFDCPVTASIQDRGKDSEALDGGTLRAQSITSVKADGVKKEKKDRFIRWQSEWGKQPAGVTDDAYVYYVFDARGSLTTQYMPYKIQFTDQPQDGAVPVAWKGTGKFTRNEGNQSVTNWQPLSGSTTTSWSQYYNLGDSYGYPEVYYVVAYPKEAEAAGKEMTNTVTFRVWGRDDDTYTEASAALKFKDDTVEFHYQGDKYSVKKFIERRDIQGALDLLKNGKQTQPMTFRCSALLDGYNLSKDASGAYGKAAWSGELIDDQLYLEGELLEPGDYEISSLGQMSAQYITNYYDEDRGVYRESWNSYDKAPVNDPSHQLKLYYRTDPNGEWILYGTYPNEKGDYPSSGKPIDWSGLGAIQMKWVATSNDYEIRYDSVYASITLKPTEHVLKLIEGKESARLYNVDALRVLDAQGNVVNQCTSDTISGTYKDQVMEHDQAGGYGLGEGRYLQHSEDCWNLSGSSSYMMLTKGSEVSSTDLTKREFTIDYSLYQSFYCRSWDVSPDMYQTLMGGLQKEATFYDLLPEGMAYKDGSVSAEQSGTVTTSGGTRSSAESTIPGENVSVEQMRNWRDSNRTMLVFHVKVPMTDWINRNVTLRFKAIYGFDAADDYGTNPVNDAAVATDLNIRECYGDSPSSPRGGAKASSNETWNAYLSDLDGDGKTGEGALSTRYSSRDVTVSRLNAGESGYTKAVKNADEDQFSKETAVDGLGSYTYRLRYRTEEKNSAKGLVFYDTLENAYGDNDHWKGTLNNVDTRYLTRNGVDAKVYYSVAEGCDPNNDEADRDLTDTSKWSTEAPADLSTVKAIAVDLTHKTDGSEYVLDAQHTALVLVNMIAPEDVIKHLYPTKDYAYNLTVATSQIKHDDSAEYTAPKTLKTLATKVSLRVTYQNLTLSKSVVGTNGDKDRAYAFDLAFDKLEPNTAYTFHVGADASGAASGYQFTTDAKGTATTTVKLKDAESLTVQLPHGATYTVTEQGVSEIRPSYKVTSGDETVAEGKSSDVGASLGTAEQKLAGDMAVSFVNENRATIDVPVRKIWKGASFGGTRPAVSLELFANGEDTGKAVELDGAVDDVETVAWQAAFKGLPKYDGNWNEIAYSVQETTQLGAGWSKEMNEPTDDTQYWEAVNTYAPTPARASIPVTKRLVYGDGLTPPDITGKFTFGIADDPSDGVSSPLPAETTVACGKDGETVRFDEVEFTAPGTYRYLITESGQVAGVENDASAETGKAVTVTVTDDGAGSLEAVVFGADAADGQASENTTFTNAYAPAPAKAAIPVAKRLTYEDGKTPPDIAGKFTFALSAKDGAPMPEVGATVTNPGSGTDHDGGTARFGEITFTAPGTYTYLITESGQVESVTNDTVAEEGKTVTVTVSDDHQGSLSALVRGADSTDSETTDLTTFENSYDEPSTPDEPSTDEPSSDEPRSPEPSSGTPSTGDRSVWVAALAVTVLAAGAGVLTLAFARRRRE